MKSTEPSSPEDLRAKIRLMAVHWSLIQLKFPTHSTVQDYSEQIWSDYVEWLLGEEVYNNDVKDASGKMVYKPSWSVLLTYEMQIRKKAMRILNNERVSLKVALGRAMHDDRLAAKYFHNPVSLAAGHHAAVAAGGNKRAAPEPDGRPGDGAAAPVVREVRPKKEQQQQNVSWKAGWTATTTGGKEKCFRFQREKCPVPFSLDVPCPDGREHACAVCGEPHPMKRCNMRPAAKAAAADEAAAKGGGERRRERAREGAGGDRVPITATPRAVWPRGRSGSRPSWMGWRPQMMDAGSLECCTCLLARSAKLT